MMSQLLLPILAPIAPRSEVDGWIYFVQSVAGGPIKVGHAMYPRLRLTDLQVGSPVRLRILATTPGSFITESAFHERLRSEHSHGEWFWPGPCMYALLRDLFGEIPADLVESEEALEGLPPPKPRTTRRGEIELPRHRCGPICPDCRKRMGPEPEKHWIWCPAPKRTWPNEANLGESEENDAS